jgi:hypothetical protein
MPRLPIRRRFLAAAHRKPLDVRDPGTDKRQFALWEIAGSHQAFITVSEIGTNFIRPGRQPQIF